MKRAWPMGLILTLIFLFVTAWQAVEHWRLRESARLTLLNRARDISNSMAVVIRSQQGYAGMILQFRLEQALEELMQSEELLSIALLNAEGEVVLQTGDSAFADYENLPHTGERWGNNAAAFMNLVDLGEKAQRDDDQQMVVIPVTEEENQRFRERMRDRFDRDDDDDDDDRRRWDDSDRDEKRREESIASATDEPSAANASERHEHNERRGERADGERRRDYDRRRGQPSFERPRWMDRDRYQRLLQKQGLHGFIIELSTDSFQQTCRRDLWMRFSILGFAFIALLGTGAAWRNLLKTSALQLRLVRASEMNNHLREMNLAAAGLAHETKNPLNVVRARAQTIAKDSALPQEIRDHSLKIAEDVDQVTAQLNEFINYSKPREPRRTPLNVNRLINEVIRTLQSDLEDKNITFTLSGPELTVAADESLVRQMIFNLLFNSVQAVNENGHIIASIAQSSKDQYRLEIRDDGPGIAPENCEKVFQPYFTTRENGTGLGLSVVHQIALAHNWEAHCLPAKHGAVFRVEGLQRLSVSAEKPRPSEKESHD